MIKPYNVNTMSSDTNLKLGRTITKRITKFGPNLGQSWTIASLRSLWFWVAIDLDLQGQIRFKQSNFLVSPLLEIHNHHTTATESWVPRLLHRPHDCFMVIVSILFAYFHAYWSRQPRVFRRLPSLLFIYVLQCQSSQHCPDALRELMDIC